MAVDIKTIEKLAQLSRLELTSEEKAKYQEEISKILEYVDQLQSLNIDLSNPLIFTEALKPESRLRQDQIIECPDDGNNLIVSGFPVKEGKLNKVKAIFE